MNVQLNDFLEKICDLFPQILKKNAICVERHDHEPERKSQELGKFYLHLPNERSRIADEIGRRNLRQKEEAKKGKEKEEIAPEEILNEGNDGLEENE